MDASIQISNLFGKNNWLSEHGRDVTSQNGEDGILEKVFELLGVDSGWCVEFGAWDGKRYSNTYNLLANRGWHGVLIEADEDRFQGLKRTYQSNDRVHCVHGFVGTDAHANLDSILRDTDIPKTYDLLSIDVDGNDLHIWQAITEYSPTVVVIEYNPTIPNSVIYAQPKDPAVSQGSSLLAIIHAFKSKNYSLIATTDTNGIFVRDEMYDAFKIEDNDINLMRKLSENESYLFQLYDGSLVLEGNRRLLWSGTEIKPQETSGLSKLPEIFSDKQQAPQAAP